MRPAVVVVLLLPALLATACTEAPPADGTRDNPFTEADPGPHASEAALHQPILWGARAGFGQVRLWIEVLDAASGARHPQEPDHYVRQISALVQENGDSLFERAFLAASEARTVGEVTFAAEAEHIDVLAECTKHGWWRRIYEKKDLDVPPNGELTRAFTSVAAGDEPELAASHVPLILSKNGGLTVEIGDRAGGALHETTPEHYVNRLIILNQDAQTLVDAPLGPDGGEPARIVDFEAGTGAVRVLAECNVHGWWETTFIIPE